MSADTRPGGGAAQPDALLPNAGGAVYETERVPLDDLVDRTKLRITAGLGGHPFVHIRGWLQNKTEILLDWYTITVVNRAMVTGPDEKNVFIGRYQKENAERPDREGPEARLWSRENGESLGLDIDESEVMRFMDEVLPIRQPIPSTESPTPSSLDELVDLLHARVVNALGGHSFERFYGSLPVGDYASIDYDWTEYEVTQVIEIKRGSLRDSILRFGKSKGDPRGILPGPFLEFRVNSEPYINQGEEIAELPRILQFLDQVIPFDTSGVIYNF